MNVKHFIEDKYLVFELTEEIDHHESEKIKKRADYEIQRLMPKRVVFDFEKVNFMDSAGIGLIIGRYKTVSCYGGKIELINVNNKLRKIFELSGLKRFIREEKLV
jgi:stage II sporulation protein AA (anti-sigma F factor antagonist)